MKAMRIPVSGSVPLRVSSAGSIPIRPGNPVEKEKFLITVSVFRDGLTWTNRNQMLPQNREILRAATYRTL